MPFLPEYVVDLTGDTSDDETLPELGLAQRKAPGTLDDIEIESSPKSSSSLSDAASRIPVLNSVEDSGSDSGSDIVTAPRGVKRKRLGKNDSPSSQSNLNGYHQVKFDEERVVPRFQIRLPPRLYPDTAFERGRRQNEMTEEAALRNLLVC